MHLAYLDDSGSHKQSPVGVFGGVVIPDERFYTIEARAGWIVEGLLPEDRRHQFVEFHAADLHNGQAPFADIPEPARFEALRRLLEIVSLFNLPFIYSAVDRKRFAVGPFGSASYIDVAFRLCALGIENWLQTQGKPIAPPPGFEGVNVTSPTLCIFIVDDTDDKPLKATLKHSFRALRPQRRDSSVDHHKKNRLRHIHDDMYFADSKDSVGIQIADVCNYFMLRHLRGEDDGEFFDMLGPRAICAKPEPDFSQCRQWLLSHKGSLGK